MAATLLRRRATRPRAFLPSCDSHLEVEAGASLISPGRVGKWEAVLGGQSFLKWPRSAVGHQECLGPCVQVCRWRGHMVLLLTFRGGRPPCWGVQPALCSVPSGRA